MTWTTDKPTVPGYYWYKATEQGPAICDVSNTRVFWAGLDESDSIDLVCKAEGSQWAGPLQPPAEVA